MNELIFFHLIRKKFEDKNGNNSSLKQTDYKHACIHVAPSIISIRIKKMLGMYTLTLNYVSTNAGFSWLSIYISLAVKLVGPQKQYFWPRINILKGFFLYPSMNQKVPKSQFQSHFWCKKSTEFFQKKKFI